MTSERLKHKGKRQTAYGVGKKAKNLKCRRIDITINTTGGEKAPLGKNH